MGLEDREWWREERRQQGHKASWDNFRAGAPRSPLPTDNEASSSGEKAKEERRTKPRTIPSYIHLQAQEILDARSSHSRPYFWPAAIGAAVGAFGYLYFFR